MRSTERRSALFFGMIEFQNITINDLSTILVAWFAVAKTWGVASGWLRSRGAKKIEDATAESHAEKAKQEAIITETKELELRQKSDEYYEQKIKKLQEQNIELAKKGEAVSKEDLPALIEAYAKKIISRKVEGLQRQASKLFATIRQLTKELQEAKADNDKLRKDNEELRNGYCPLLAQHGGCELLGSPRCRDPM